MHPGSNSHCQKKQRPREPHPGGICRFRRHCSGFFGLFAPYTLPIGCLRKCEHHLFNAPDPSTLNNKKAETTVSAVSARNEWIRSSPPSRVVISALAPAELALELLHASCGIHKTLLSSVSRMRIRRDIAHKQFVLHAVDGFLALRLHGRYGEKLLACGHVLETSRTQFGMPLFFHDSKDKWLISLALPCSEDSTCR